MPWIPKSGGGNGEALAEAVDGFLMDFTLWIFNDFYYG